MPSLIKPFFMFIHVFLKPFSDILVRIYFCTYQSIYLCILFCLPILCIYLFIRIQLSVCPFIYLSLYLYLSQIIYLSTCLVLVYSTSYPPDTTVKSGPQGLLEQNAVFSSLLRIQDRKRTPQCPGFIATGSGIVWREQC